MLRLFENDPESAPKPRSSFADDLVGRFRSGYQVNGRPAALEKWRVTTGDPEVAEAVRAIMGGDAAQAWDSRGDDKLEIFTEASVAMVVLPNAKALRSEMILWSRAGKPIRRCDGAEQSGEGKVGLPCACPSAFAARKEAATEGTGCEPNISVTFSLEAAPDLGQFQFRTGSWSLVRDLGEAELALSRIAAGVKIRASISLEVVEFQPKSGGAKRRFTKPVLDILGAVA